MNTFRQAYYYADDKDLSDLMEMALRHYGIEKILQLARDRGFVFSEQVMPSDLIAFLSRQPFSWPQIQELLKISHGSNRKEKQQPLTVKSKAKINEIEVAFNQVKKSRESQAYESLTLKKQSGDTLVVQIGYSEFDTSRTRLMQRRDREATIIIQKTIDGFKMQNDANEKASEVRDQIIKALSQNAENETSAREICLTGIREANLRTEFFVALITNLPDMKLKDVLSIKVDRLRHSGGDVDLDSIEDDVGREGDGGARRMEGVVKRVSIHGLNLLYTKEYQSLKEDGFFVSKIGWASKEDKPQGRVFVFEAEFGDAQAASDFKFSFCGVYNQRSDGGLKKAKEAVDVLDEPWLRERILQSATTSMDLISTK